MSMDDKSNMGGSIGPNRSMAEADPERVKVWVDATRAYGMV